MIDLIGFNFGTSLVIQGGVNGGTTTFVRTLNVVNNSDLDFTLNDVTLSPSHVSLSDYAFYSQNNSGKYIFNNVQVLNSNSGGLYVLGHDGDMDLQNVTADTNQANNIHITGVTGNVVMTDVQGQNSPSGLGITLSNIQGKKGVTLTNVYAINNYADNLQIVSITGDVSISNSTAYASKNGDGISINTVYGKKGVIINNTASDANNGINIYIQSIDSSVSLMDVDANASHTSSGIFINNVDGSKGNTLSNINATVNTGSNISLVDLEGGASLSGIEADSSGGNGVSLYNIGGKKGVVFNGGNVSGNTLDNIFAVSITGNVSLSDVNAHSSSTQNGIFMENLLGVNLSNINASGNKLQNLHIAHLAGDVTLKSVVSSGTSADEGIFIYNVQGKKGVTLSDIEANSNLDTNIVINTVDNNVSLSNVNANLGNYWGISIGNVSGSKGVSLSNVFANDNSWENLSIFTIAGNVVLKNIEAKASANSTGLVLNGISGSKGITISTADTSGNKGNGTTIQNITGNVKITGLTSSGSTNWRGIDLLNVYGSSGVSLSNVTADNNQSLNLSLSGISGNATLSSVHASGSKTGYGIVMYNVMGSQGVTLKSIVTEDNYDTNIYIHEVTGAVSAKSVTANNSSLYRGFNVTDVYGSKGVKIIDLTSSLNFSHNVDIATISGDVSLTGVAALGSKHNVGLNIDDVQGAKGVYIKNGEINENDGNNINITDVIPGNVTLSNVNANNSQSANGANFSGSHGVLMVVSGVFNGNNQSGIYIASHEGLIMIKTVEGSDNVNGDGARISSNNNQLVCTSTFNNNAVGYGLYSNAPGFSITTSNVIHLSNLVQFYTTASTTWYDSAKCKVIPVP